MSENLTDKLAKGDEDLINILVGSGISCASCQKNPNGNTTGFICENGFCSFPKLNLCMHWRERRTEAELREHIKYCETLETEG